jgi:hypothetical protein
MPLDDTGRTLLVVGVLIAIVGGLVLIGDQLAWLGRLPGDISVERDNVRLYVPLATCLLLSLILTIVLNIFSLGVNFYAQLASL